MQVFKNEILEIKKHKKIVFILLDIPTGGELSLANLYSRSFISSQKNLPIQQGLENFLTRDHKYREKLIQIAKETDSKIIDPVPYLSFGNSIITTNNDGPIRCDDSHLRPGFVKENAVWIDQTVTP